MSRKNERDERVAAIQAMSEEEFNAHAQNKLDEIAEVEAEIGRAARRLGELRTDLWMDMQTRNILIFQAKSEANPPAHQINAALTPAAAD